MFIHDVIKIKLSREGYLPDYPPHLLSDAEMCYAFLPYNYDPDDPYSGYDSCMDTELNFFRDKYPLIDPSLEDSYKTLVSEIAYHIYNFNRSVEDDARLPYWVYSYMLESALSVSSDKLDLHDFFVLLGTDNLLDEYDLKCANACYAESKSWLTKLSSTDRLHRPPTMFGEPHVIKSLRLKAASNLS